MSEVKDSVLSSNFTVAWEQVFGEKFINSVIKAMKQNKENTVKKDNFILERLLGCEVLFGDTLYHVHYIYHAGAVAHLVFHRLKIFQDKAIVLRVRGRHNVFIRIRRKYTRIP